MQVYNKYNMVDRGVQHLTKLHAEQLESGQDYKETKKAIVIIIADYNICARNTYHSTVHLKYEDYPKSTYLPMYEKEEETLTDKLEIHFIEIKKFLKLKNIKGSKLEQWLQLISGERKLIKVALSKNAEKIKKAYEELQYLSQDEKARQEFDEYQSLKLDEQMMKHYAKEQGRKEGREQGLEEGRKKGLEQGIKQGIEQGIKQGIKQGIEQGQSKNNLEIAKKMLEEDVDIDFIIRVTGLTKEEIEKLQKPLDK